MKKKILALVIILICIISAVYYGISHKNKSSNAVTNKPVTEFKVRSAFADVDLDMTIQDKDPKDDDTSGDYVFITFTNEIADNKKSDDSNPISLKSYKLDNSSLPAGTKISIKNKNQVIIKLKNGYLKGINAPHSLTISKNLVNKEGSKLKGDLALKLPYSNSSTDSNTTNNSQNGSGSTNNNGSNNTTNNTNNNNTNNNNTNSKNSGTNKNSANESSSGSTSNNQNSNMPKYTIELGKAVPGATVVLVRLNAPNPENYKVSIEGTQLKLKTDSKGKKVFIDGFKKVYELDQVQKLIKIEKAK